MRVDTFLPHTTLRDVQRVAREAEAVGFDGVCASEITLDPFLALGAAALVTERVSLRTAIAVAFARSPMITAGLAWALHVESGGRMVLGLGTQVQAHNERRFSVPWSAPAARLRDYAGAVRATWRTWEHGEPLRFASEHYPLSLMTPEFSPPPSGLPPVPVYFAAVRPRMLELAGEHADGVRLHGFCTRRYLDEVVLPALDRGLASSGRTRADIEVCGGGFVATGPDAAAVAEARQWARYRVAFYASTPSYRPVLTLHGWDELADRLHGLSRAGKWKAMAECVPDEVLDAFVCAGTYDEIGARVRDRFGGVSDTVELRWAARHDGIERALADLRAIPRP